MFNEAFSDIRLLIF